MTRALLLTNVVEAAERDLAARVDAGDGAGAVSLARTRDLRDAPYVVVLLIAAVGIGYSSVQPQHWLRGVGVVAVAMFVGAVLRAVLTDRQAGLLAVRHRRFDVLCYGLLGAAIIGIGLLLPH